MKSKTKRKRIAREKIKQDNIVIEPQGEIISGGYKKVDTYNDPEHSGLMEISRHYAEIIKLLGEDTKREGLLKTPVRISQTMQFLTRGYHQNPAEILRRAMFKQAYSEMVVVKDIEIYSLCEHHLLPFFGKAHVAYIPNGCIVGLSKIARVVDAFANRLQVQEKLTMEIRDCIQRTMNPLGVAVVIEAKHLCMLMRGIQKQNSVATTSAVSGAFENEVTRGEFLKIIGSKLM